MFTLESVEGFKTMAQVLIEVLSAGTIYVISDREQITWKAPSYI